MIGIERRCVEMEYLIAVFRRLFDLFVDEMPNPVVRMAAIFGSIEAVSIVAAGTRPRSERQ